MALNDVYKCSWIFTAPGADDEMVVTAHYRTIDVVTPGSGQDEAFEIAQEARLDCENTYLSIITPDITFERTGVIGITDPLVTSTSASGLPGVAVGDVMAYRNAPVVKLLSGLRGRTYNGRQFWMAPPESAQNAGVLTTSYTDTLRIFVNGLVVFNNVPSGNSYRMTIYSRKLTLQTGSIVDNLVTQVATNSVLGTQRSRQKVN